MLNKSCLDKSYFILEQFVIGMIHWDPTDTILLAQRKVRRLLVFLPGCIPKNLRLQNSSGN